MDRHCSGTCLDLNLTDIPDVILASALAPIGTSGHNVIHYKICVDFTVPDITISRVSWDNVCYETYNIQWYTIYFLNPMTQSLL